MTHITPRIEMPEAEPNGFVKTLNQMGYMTSILDPFSAEFVKFAAEFCPAGSSAPAVDIGAAYGVATLAALKMGAQIVANDMDSRHLDILSDRVPNIYKSHLELKVGKFPEELDFKAKSIGAFLICRVLHFFNGHMLEAAAGRLFQWLRPGGKVFVVAETPYLKGWESFIPIYEKRKQDGHLWPGFIEDVQEMAPLRAPALPPQMHFLDDEILIRIFTRAGFVIEKCQIFARPEFPLDLQLDGRESVGLIARKKLEANQTWNADFGSFLKPSEKKSPQT